MKTRSNRNLEVRTLVKHPANLPPAQPTHAPPTPAPSPILPPSTAPFLLSLPPHTHISGASSPILSPFPLSPALSVPTCFPPSFPPLLQSPFPLSLLLYLITSSTRPPVTPKNADGREVENRIQPRNKLSSLLGDARSWTAS